VVGSRVPISFSYTFSLGGVISKGLYHELFDNSISIIIIIIIIISLTFAAALHKVQRHHHPKQQQLQQHGVCQAYVSPRAQPVEQETARWVLTNMLHLRRHHLVPTQHPIIQYIKVHIHILILCRILMH